MGCDDMTNITTGFGHIDPHNDGEMTGNEKYPVVGELIDGFDMAVLMVICKGMNPFWDCYPKARIVQEYMDSGYVVIGAMKVWNAMMTANYGYECNLPLEFHAWWQTSLDPDSPIVDIALPGVIQKGIDTKDELGSIIVGRTPCILAGKPLDWMKYEAKFYLDSHGNLIQLPCSQNKGMTFEDAADKHACDACRHRDTDCGLSCVYSRTHSTICPSCSGQIFFSGVEPEDHPDCICPHCHTPLTWNLKGEKK